MCCQSLQELVGLFPTVYGCILRMRDRLPEILCNRLTSSVVLVRILLIQMPQEQKFFLEWRFLSFSSSIISAYPEARKQASVIRTYCRPVIGCLRANPHASASAALIAFSYLAIPL